MKCKRVRSPVDSDALRGRWDGTMRSAVWEKNGRRMTGSWVYNRHMDRFYICLDSRDKVTGRNRELTVSGEKPEFNGWELADQPDVEETNLTANEVSQPPSNTSYQPKRPPVFRQQTLRSARSSSYDASGQKQVH